jgi:hypothetical protein
LSWAEALVAQSNMASTPKEDLGLEVMSDHSSDGSWVLFEANLRKKPGPQRLSALT